MNSRPFDPHWTTPLPTLTKYLEGLCSKLTGAEQRIRKRNVNSQANFEAAIKSIVLDLYRAHESDPSLHVGIATGQGSLQKLSKGRYGASLLSPRTFRAAMDVLVNLDHVIMTAPHWDDPSRKNSRTARYQASRSLILALRNAGASFTSLCRHRGAEGIRLKDEKKRLVEYGDVGIANEARDKLRTINDMLEGHWADLALTDQQLSKEVANVSGQRDEEASQSFDFAARTLHRVFNNSDWEQGGRFYGAWWISCPSELRKYIFIDGKPTVEVDYSGLHAAMLFAEAGMAIPDDPYARCLSGGGSPARRKLVKETFNALLNAGSVHELQEIDGYSEELAGQAWGDFKRFIVSCFPEFKQHFGSGVGIRLQFKDSQLAEAVMLEFATHRYPCLPVHDSFIVHHALQDKLTTAMQAAFEAEFGAVGQVKFEIGVGEVVVPSDKPLTEDIDKLLHPTGYEARLQDFWATNKIINNSNPLLSLNQ